MISLWKGQWKISSGQSSNFSNYRSLKSLTKSFADILKRFENLLSRKSQQSTWLQNILASSTRWTYRRFITLLIYSDIDRDFPEECERRLRLGDQVFMKFSMTSDTAYADMSNTTQYLNHRQQVTLISRLELLILVSCLVFCQTRVSL